MVGYRRAVRGGPCRHGLRCRSALLCSRQRCQDRVVQLGFFEQRRARGGNRLFSGRRGPYFQGCRQFLQSNAGLYGHAERYRQCRGHRRRRLQGRFFQFWNMGGYFSPRRQHIEPVPRQVRPWTRLCCQQERHLHGNAPCRECGGPHLVAKSWFVRRAGKTKTVRRRRSHRSMDLQHFICRQTRRRTDQCL